MSIVKKLGKDIPWHLRKLLVGHSSPWNQTFLLLLQEWLHLQSHILYISISSWIVRHQPVLDSSRIKIIMNMWIDLAVKQRKLDTELAVFCSSSCSLTWGPCSIPPKKGSPTTRFAARFLAFSRNSSYTFSWTKVREPAQQHCPCKRTILLVEDQNDYMILASYPFFFFEVPGWRREQSVPFPQPCLHQHPHIQWKGIFRQAPMLLASDCFLRLIQVQPSLFRLIQ